jgi:HEAT repeat protein/DNA polymerase III delta prime subunit
MVDSSQIRAYLKGLSGRYEQWRRDNALTDTIVNQQATFTFNQFVQTEEGQPGEPLVEGIHHYLLNQSEHVLLVGSPGVGKSSALWHCLNTLAKEELEASEPRIPVLVQLKAYRDRSISAEDPHGLLTLIKSSIRPRLRLSLPEIDTLLCDQRLILLLDGLNEIPAGVFRTHLQQFRDECRELEIPLICSTREMGGGDLGIQRKLEIQPLKSEETDRFLQECLPEHQDQVRQLLQRDNRDLSRTPFVLWMLYHLLQETGTIAETIGEAFRQFFRFHCRSYKEDAPVPEERRKAWNSWMEHLAFTMLSSPDPLDPGLVINKERAENILAERFGESKGHGSRILELGKYYLLAPVSDRETSFKHQLIQEYYAAESLLEKLKEEPHLLQKQSEQEYTPFQMRYLNYLKWTEVISLMLGLPEVSEQGEELVRLAGDVDFLLAATLTKAVNKFAQAKALESVKAKMLDTAPNKPSWLELRLYKNIGTEVIMDHLLPFLDHPDYRTRGHAYILATKIAPQSIPDQCLVAREHSRIKRILDSIPENNEREDNQRKSDYIEGARSEEENVLEQETLDVLHPEILQLYSQYRNQEISRDVFIQSTAPRLNDSEKNIRLSASIVLESLNSTSTLQVFVDSVQNPDLPVDSSVVEAIGRLGGAEVIPQLINLLEQHPDSSVRCSAVSALRFISSDEIIPGIRQGLKDADMWVCDQAIRATDEVASEEIVVELLNIISISHNAHLRRLAAHQLKMLSLRDGLSDFLCKNHLLSLVNLLEDQDVWVRWYISLAIWNLGTEQVIPLLEAKLQNEDSDIRLSAALPLGRFGDTKATSYLIQIMNHENLVDHPDISGISYTAAYALGKVDKNSAAQYLPELFSLLSTNSGENCLYAIDLIQSQCGFYSHEIQQEFQKIRIVEDQDLCKLSEFLY